MASTSTTASAASTTTAGAYLASFAPEDALLHGPSNGDVNPCGIVLVPSSIGKLHAGQLLVSNFNDSANDQGTGTTIEEITRAGMSTLFATISAKSLPGSCPGGVGLTTALNILPGGYVLVGSLPTTNGKSATAKYGCLIVLDSNGSVIKTIAGVGTCFQLPAALTTPANRAPRPRWAAPPGGDQHALAIAEKH